MLYVKTVIPVSHFSPASFPLISLCNISRKKISSKSLEVEKSSDKLLNLAKKVIIFMTFLFKKHYLLGMSLATTLLEQA